MHLATVTDSLYTRCPAISKRTQRDESSNIYMASSRAHHLPRVTDRRLGLLAHVLRLPPEQQVVHRVRRPVEAHPLAPVELLHLLGEAAHRRAEALGLARVQKHGHRRAKRPVQRRHVRGHLVRQRAAAARKIGLGAPLQKLWRQNVRRGRILLGKVARRPRRHLDPRRPRKDGARQRQRLGLLEVAQQREDEVATGRVAGQDHVPGAVAEREDVRVKGHGVLDRGWEALPGGAGEAVLRPHEARRLAAVQHHIGGLAPECLVADLDDECAAGQVQHDRLGAEVRGIGRRCLGEPERLLRRGLHGRGIRGQDAGEERGGRDGGRGDAGRVFGEVLGEEPRGARRGEDVEEPPHDEVADVGLEAQPRART